MKKPRDKDIDDICYFVYDQLRGVVGPDCDRKAIEQIIAPAVWRAFQECSNWK